MEDAFFHIEKHGGRGIGSVSHFFLTDHGALNPIPHRSDLKDNPGEESKENISLDAQSNVGIILCPNGFSPWGSSLGCMLALSLAASDISVGLIETTTRLPHPFFLSGGYQNLNAVFWEADLDSPEFLNMVDRFRNACDFVLINAAASVLLKTGGPTGLMGRYLVPTTIRAQDLLNAYGTIKNASKQWAITEIELVVIKEHPTDNAAGAAVVLEKMARGFLPCSVRFVGAVTLATDVDASGALSSTPSLRALPDAAVAAIKDVARNLIVSGGSRKKRRPHVEKRI